MGGGQVGRRDMLREGAAGGPEILPPGPRDRARDAPRGWSRDRALEMAEASGWPPLDLSLGVPAESPPELSRPGGGVRTGLSPARYPLSAGSLELRTTAADYLARRFRVTVSISAVAACAGAKEFISTVPSFLRATRGKDVPERDLALIPALGYPPYEFGARLAGLTVRRGAGGAADPMDLHENPPPPPPPAPFMWGDS